MASSREGIVVWVQGDLVLVIRLATVAEGNAAANSRTYSIIGDDMVYLESGRIHRYTLTLHWY